MHHVQRPEPTAPPHAHPAGTTGPPDHRVRALAALHAGFAYEQQRTADAQTAITWLSGPVEAATGYSREALLALPSLYELALPDDQPALAQHLGQLEAGEMHQVDFRIRTQAGAVRWLRERAQATTPSGPDGPLHIVATVQDVTDRVEEERLLHVTRLAVDQAAEPMLRVDAEGRFTYANEAACRMLGYTAAEMADLHIHSVDPHLTRRAWPAWWSQVHKQSCVTVEATYRTRDSRLFPVEINATVIRYQGEEHAVLFVRDITERKNYEGELVQARQKAEEMSRLKSAFLENMSHEIRTPLAAIIGFAAILLEELPDTHRRFLNFIERSGKRLLDTLNSILNLSMLESGSVKPNREVLDVAAEVQDKAQLLRPLAEEKGIALEVDAADGVVEAFLDRVCLDRVLTNLISNAIKFTHEGRIVVAVSSPADRVEIVIRDTGIGISEAFLPHLFSDFKQETMGRSRSYEGIGLGLAITKRMVDLMGGEIKVQTVQGQGSTFTVSFPQLVIHRRSPSAGAATIGSLLPAQRARILALEDNPDMLVLLKHYLGTHYDVVTAADEETAMQLAVQQHYDLVMMDINLGRDRNGLDVLVDLRRVDGYQHTPVVAVTAYALPGDRERFIDAGFDGYLGKPFTRTQLRHTVDNVLTAS